MISARPRILIKVAILKSFALEVWVSIYFFFFVFGISGFTGRNVTRSLPPIHHVNKDGYLPHVEVQSSATESNFVFLLCDQTNNNNINNNTYIPYPYIVIREKQVKTESSVH